MPEPTSTAHAAGTTAAAVADPAASPGQDPEAVITAERSRIDALDARIIALVRDRMEVSETIQRVRIASGGRRVHLTREMEILDHYSGELGGAGRDLAMTLLRLCRGH
ncbi:chorismate mutase [Streptomyces sp. PHES57]|uniref:chorismate mutase n=1 Tax=Streptomyces TaxID=1883 RepID=UPI001CEC4EA5|nr:chorismate mutase [Streptomyces sp. PHES57]